MTLAIASIVATIAASSFHAATSMVTAGHRRGPHGPTGGSSGSSRYGASSSVNAMNPITRPGTYASRIGISQAITGPIASSRSCRHGSDTTTAKPTQAAVSTAAPANRTVGRSPTVGARRRVRPPSGGGAVMAGSATV